MIKKIGIILVSVLVQQGCTYGLVKNNSVSKFSFSNVVELAKKESQLPYVKEEIKVPESIVKLDYSQYISIRYKLDHDLWGNENLPFRISFFPVGTSLYTIPVIIYEVDPGKEPKMVTFNPDYFSYGKNVEFAKKDMLKDAGYAGFKIRYQSEDGSYPNEFAVFLGGCYFRAISNGASYGLSNRGVGINTGLENVSEEFPVFEKFWLVKPEKGDNKLTIYAYLNGESITGAYSFTIMPGEKAKIDVKSVLFLRKKVKLLAISPITSMFWFTCTRGEHFSDYRPSVHNSQGLIVSCQNKTIWDLLVNYPQHKMLNNDIHCDTTPNYYGLIQRNRDYNFYMDPSVKYQLNPNCWIIPQNNWGSGNIRLFILPTTTEWMDNINTFWIPDKLPELGKGYEFDYKIIYALTELESNLDYVAYTNIGKDQNNPDNTVFVLSFKDKTKEIEKNSKDIKIKLEVPDGVKIILEPTIERIPYNDTWRVIFTLASKKLSYGDKPYIIKLTLLLKNRPISECWYFQWF